MCVTVFNYEKMHEVVSIDVLAKMLGYESRKEVPMVDVFPSIRGKCAYDDRPLFNRPCLCMVNVSRAVALAGWELHVDKWGDIVLLPPWNRSSMLYGGPVCKS